MLVKEKDPKDVNIFNTQVRSITFARIHPPLCWPIPTTSSHCSPVAAATRTRTGFHQRASTRGLPPVWAAQAWVAWENLGRPGYSRRETDRPLQEQSGTRVQRNFSPCERAWRVLLEIWVGEDGRFVVTAEKRSGSVTSQRCPLQRFHCNWAALPLFA